MTEQSAAIGRPRPGSRVSLPFRWRLLIPLFVALLVVDAFPLAYAFVASVQRFLLSGRDL